ncbi:MAG: ATP-dependent helicase [Candidatus Abyssobacteria bacterium SURF_5]|uniref:DNA 3'-5' helicase n=1 Tax=Abyssobacteria bacterium (strain SURF_5) TaxID=2093360 RepID=A0A3A4P1R4_ABYX5|nr:MAG: ATP-dependent helicase [Candidatus Abyssubacteria bacterium SURF_5]
MISWPDFEKAVLTFIQRDIRKEKNLSQYEAIKAAQGSSLYLIAGPGSGKTTVITLRVLKLIYLDEMDPSNVLVTTFTRKAAAELRSRILGWGDQLRAAFLKDSSYEKLRSRLKSLDFNRIITGTLDSIAEETLGNYRAPGAPAPIVVQDFVSNALMMRTGLFSNGRYKDPNLLNYVASLRGGTFGLNVPELSSTLREIKDRFFHDQIDISAFQRKAQHLGAQIACDAITAYNQELQKKLLYDFAKLEAEFFQQILSQKLNSFLQNIKFVLIDEYQDTNLLQEKIYFELTRAALINKGSITVVGDDDQSLYRFRGATVELFRSFEKRMAKCLNLKPVPKYLSLNYRSTPTIVEFINNFIGLDQQFQKARVNSKPKIKHVRQIPEPQECPILGMFRDDVGSLAHDLAVLIEEVSRGQGLRIPQKGQAATIKLNKDGSLGDIALLCSSPQEFDYSDRPRLPFLLRTELHEASPRIEVFNPRGCPLQQIPEVQVLCGLILECVDPWSSVQKSLTNLPTTAANTFNSWRDHAMGYVNNNHLANKEHLQQFVQSWQSRIPLGRRIQKKERVPLNDLVYKLVTWIPSMQDDIEGLVYLEAITRSINQSGLFGSFGAEILFDPNKADIRLEHAFVKEALWNIFVPLASGAIEVNEDLLDTLPSDRVNIMSIHQAKGLEFPFVIVDVGSDFRINHWRQAFKRFPRDGGKTCKIEDELRQFSPLGTSTRSSLDRAFDDLIRHYFVAFSRAQDVLLLVGLNAVKNRIRNIGTGWDRGNTWHWGRGLQNLTHLR